MKKIERLPHAAIVLKPTIAFLNWSLPFHDPLAKVHLPESDVFMIPDLDDAMEIHDWLMDHFTDLFVHFLSEWTDMQVFWPNVEDYAVFSEFFEREIISMAWRVND
ncbi:MAG: hypothetical protein RLZZ205_752 [Bacteroidota bacterium]